MIAIPRNEAARGAALHTRQAKEQRNGDKDLKTFEKMLEFPFKFFSPEKQGNSMHGKILSNMSTRVTNFFKNKVPLVDKVTHFVKRRSKITAPLFVET